MKKLIFTFAIVLISLLTSCSADEVQEIEAVTPPIENPTTGSKTIIIDEVGQGIAINKVKIYKFVNGSFSVVNQDQNNPTLEVRNGDKVRIVYELYTPDAVDSNDFIVWKYGNQGTPQTILPTQDPQRPNQLMLSVDFDVIF